MDVEEFLQIVSGLVSLFTHSFKIMKIFIIVPNYVLNSIHSTDCPFMVVTSCVWACFLKSISIVFHFRYVYLKLWLLTPLHKVFNDQAMDVFIVLEQAYNNRVILMLYNGPVFIFPPTCLYRGWIIRVNAHILVGIQSRSKVGQTKLHSPLLSESCLLKSPESNLQNSY